MSQTAENTAHIRENDNLSGFTHYLLSEAECFSRHSTLIYRGRVNFWNRLKTNDSGCIEWQGARLRQSCPYGVLTIGKKAWRAHRLAYVLAYGSIPKSMDVLHRCDNPPCVNPLHLFVGTDKDNHQDKTRKGRHPQAAKTHCPQGHPYTEENIYRVPSTNGRACRICRKNRSLRVGTLQETRVSQ